MIGRGGMVVDERSWVAGWSRSRPGSARHECRGSGLLSGLPDTAMTCAIAADLPWLKLLAATASLAGALAVLPGRTSIPPLIESDYCYLLTAAERLLDGKGLTATPPVAPFQPWEWRADWAFLTQWPAGYPLLIAALRLGLRLTTLEAARLISIVACAAALVGWFAVAWRSAPTGLTRFLLAASAAAASVSVAGLVNLSTDLIVTAAVPWLILLLNSSLAASATAKHPPEGAQASRASVFSLALCGLLAGGLVWFRYAAVFVPVALIAYSLILWLRRELEFSRLVIVASGTAAPIGVLLGMNYVFGPPSQPLATINLGQSIGFDFSWRLLVDAWGGLTSFSFYAHHDWVNGAFAAFPIVLATLAAATRSGREALRTLLRNRAWVLGALLTSILLLMLIAATCLFSEKFHYVSLDRYYQPIKPLYFILFVGPLMLIQRRVVRAGLCVLLFLILSWTWQQDWSRTYARWRNGNRPATASGYWSRCFEPNAAALYDWLRRRDSTRLIVVSNFHEYIELETGIPALPIPPDPATLDRWISKIRVARGIASHDGLEILFVLDPENRWRDHWIADPQTVVAAFGLDAIVNGTPNYGAIIRAYRPDALTSISRATPAICGGIAGLYW